MSAADLVESFDLNRLPDTFYDNPFTTILFRIIEFYVKATAIA